MNLPQRVANLEHWLSTMRQPGGYGGPVAHWWQNRYAYTGPGLDWRYEGILHGYSTLFQKTGDGRWQRALETAASDIITAQDARGHYPASRFELNPGKVGTPHEAAATLGLLAASDALSDPARALETAQRNLCALISALWDDSRAGFNDVPGVPGRVPNKLATMAEALLRYTQLTGDSRILHYARSALDDVCRYQVIEGRFAGAVHQYAPGAGRGDGRFFPYYNARCVAPLLLGAEVFCEARYRDAAMGILSFLQATVMAQGSWPQVVYLGGQRARWPQWLAGVADILLAYRALGQEPPERALARLLEAQTVSGAFPTAFGFASQISQRQPAQLPDYRDATPVVGWNDKVFRLLTVLLPAATKLPLAQCGEVAQAVTVWGKQAVLKESERSLTLTQDGEVLYAWRKRDPWARTVSPGLEVR